MIPVQKNFKKSKKRRKHYEQIAKADRVTRCDNQKESFSLSPTTNSKVSKIF